MALSHKDTVRKNVQSSSEKQMKQHLVIMFKTNDTQMISKPFRALQSNLFNYLYINWIVIFFFLFHSWTIDKLLQP